MKKRDILIFTSGIVVTLVTGFITIYLINKKEIKYINFENSNLLSMMLETDVGSGKYEKAKQTSWPSEGYIFNPYLSKCENGSKLSWQDGKVVVTAASSDKCYVYFDKPKTFTLLTAQDITDEDATLTNILGEDGNFEENELFSNCIITNEQKKYGNNSCKLVATENVRESTATSINKYYLNSAHMYLMKIAVYGAVNSSAQAYWPITEPSFFIKDVTIGWIELSFINNRTSFDNGEYPIRIDFNNYNKAGEMYFDGLMIIDLTESYNEKIPSKEWLDTNLLYFDNQANIKTVEGLEGEFTVPNAQGTFRCSEGGEATIKDGKVIMKGKKDNTTCVLE